MKRFLLPFIFFNTFSAHASLTEGLTCPPSYAGKPFVQVTIWSSVDGFGPAECDYKNPGDAEFTVFSFPKENEYYVVSGYWKSTMPGYRWCSVDNGNTAATCKFAQRVTD